LTYVIGGKEYTLTNDEWMFPASDIQMGNLAQGGKMMMNFEHPGPLGP